MASSNKTNKLELPQWQLNDKSEMADFNNAFENIEDFKDEFDSHKAESANKHITESGSNVNGYYIKFDNGIQICWGNIVLDDNSGTGKTFTFPANFVNIAYSLQISAVSTASGSVSSSYVIESQRVDGGVLFRGKSLTHSATTIVATTSVACTFIAIGRWK